MPVGDVNQDGYDDIILSAQGWNGPPTDGGRALIYLGSPTGPSQTPAWIPEYMTELVSLGPGGVPRHELILSARPAFPGHA